MTCAAHGLRSRRAATRLAPTATPIIATIAATETTGEIAIHGAASIFAPGKREHRRQPVAQVPQPGDRVDQHDVQRAQPEHREHVRAVDDERLLG